MLWRKKNEAWWKNRKCWQVGVQVLLGIGWAGRPPSWEHIWVETVRKQRSYLCNWRKCAPHGGRGAGSAEALERVHTGVPTSQQSGRWGWGWGGAVAGDEAEEIAAAPVLGPSCDKDLDFYSWVRRQLWVLKEWMDWRVAWSIREECELWSWLPGLKSQPWTHRLSDHRVVV